MEGDEIQRGLTVEWWWLGFGGSNDFWGLIGKFRSSIDGIRA